MDDRNIGRLDAAIGEIDRGWRFRCTADADDNQIGFIESPAGNCPSSWSSVKLSASMRLKYSSPIGVLSTDAAAGKALRDRTETH
jgi:hypothetical protein